MLSLIWMLGCTQPFKDTADVFSGEESDADADADVDLDLDEETDALEADPDCEEVLGETVPGATSYFLAEFEINGDDVTGTERWALFANGAWKETGNDDCMVTWSVSGTAAEPTATCGSCDYSLDITANADASLTDCPDELWKDEREFSVVYNVKLLDGSAIFYFAGSGDELATGTGSLSSATYLTEATCTYF